LNVGESATCKRQYNKQSKDTQDGQFFHFTVSSNRQTILDA
jgi:hypothetical protein